MMMRSLELLVLLLLTTTTTPSSTHQHEMAAAAATKQHEQENEQEKGTSTTPPSPPNTNIVSISYSDLESYFHDNDNNKVLVVVDDEEEISSAEGYCQQKQDHDEANSGVGNCDDNEDDNDNDHFSSTSTTKHKLSQKLHQAIEDGFGTDGGLGFLEVTDLPLEKVKLRSTVLMMAHQLANLPSVELTKLEMPQQQYTIGWSRGKEEFKPGIPDIGKGSFYYNPFPSANNNNDLINSTSSDTAENKNNVFPDNDVLPNFEQSLEEMTHFMAKVGLWIVQLIDEHLNLNIYQSLESCEMAKARLLYYYPTTTTTTTTTTNNSSSEATSAAEKKKTHSSSNDDENNNDIMKMRKKQQQQQHFNDDYQWWCGWHKDHGSITALLPGELIPVDENIERSEKKEEGGLRVADPNAGLYIDNLSSHYRRRDGQQQQQQSQNKNHYHHVVLPSTSLGFQLGETIELMTHGRLRATPHAVKAPSSSSSSSSSSRGISNNNVGRASLALFLQPPADQSLPPILIDDDDNDEKENVQHQQPKRGFIDDSLRSRWRPTFGEFQQATVNAFN